MICIEAQLQSIEILVVGQILPFNASLTMYYLGLQGNNKPVLIPFLKSCADVMVKTIKLSTCPWLSSFLGIEPLQGWVTTNMNFVSLQLLIENCGLISVSCLLKVNMPKKVYNLCCMAGKVKITASLGYDATRCSKQPEAILSINHTRSGASNF